VIATEPVILITKEPNAECRARTFSAPAAGRWRDTIEAHSFSALRTKYGVLQCFKRMMGLEPTTFCMASV
jgi:hypothetical protein